VLGSEHVARARALTHKNEIAKVLMRFGDFYLLERLSRML